MAPGHPTPQSAATSTVWRSPKPVFALEGPDHLAELAEQLSRQAASVQRCWRQVAVAPSFRFGPIDSDRVDPEQEITPRDPHGHLKEPVQGFTRAARLHLNAH
jgi:hypothetical protein